MRKKVFYKSDIDRNSIISVIKNVLEEEGRVVFAYLYGSFADASAFFYDIDIAVYATTDENPHSLAVNIKEKIADALRGSGVDGFTADDFDVRIINAAPCDFAVNILDEGLLIADKDERIRTSYIEHISMEYRLNQIVLAEALR